MPLVYRAMSGQDHGLESPAEGQHPPANRRERRLQGRQRQPANGRIPSRYAL
jgi:hypothetical protein